MEDGETIQGFQVTGVPGDRTTIVAERPAEYVTRAELAEVEARLTARLDAVLAAIDRVAGMLEGR